MAGRSSAGQAGPPSRRGSQRASQGVLLEPEVKMRSLPPFLGAGLSRKCLGIFMETEASQAEFKERGKRAVGQKD